MEFEKLLSKIDFYREEINKRRPLTPIEVKELDSYYRIGTTYSSNALEGNSLTLMETKILLEDGITVGGKPIRDFYEATGHANAYDFMLSVARSEKLLLTEDIIKKLHFLFYNAIDSEHAGRYREHQVFITGTEYIPPSAKQIPSLMKDFIADFNVKTGSLHTVELATLAHRGLADIHPFIDGNGRTARLLMNLILVNKGYLIISIPPILRHEYISALMASQRTNNPTDMIFKMLIAECEIESLRDYCRMFGISLKVD